MKKAATLSTLLTMFLLVLAVTIEAQQPRKIPRIGYLSGTTRITDLPRAEATRRALRELGYIEGQNIVVEYRHAAGKRGGQVELAAELVRLKVDLILVAGGDGGIRAAMNATTTIPIVLMGFGSDPVEAGFVKSLARPGGNVTGFTRFSRELGGKRMELLKEAVAKLSHVAVLYDPGVPGTAREVKEDLPAAARGLGLTIQPWEIRYANDFEKTFAALTKNRPDGVYSPGGGSLIRKNEERIAEFALNNRLPSMFNEPEGVDGGGFMYYGADQAESYRRVAYFVDRILKGTKPADLPVERSTKFVFIINLKTAMQIGLTIPPDLLARATKIIR